jgi:anti-sigma regulatory factor (Ser/Thr protein kinase)
MGVSCETERRSTGFDHQAVFYRGLEGLRAHVVPYVREGVRNGEQVLVAMVAEHVAEVERALGSVATRVDFVDMAELGGNPACILPEWRRFVADLAFAEGPQWQLLCPYDVGALPRHVIQEAVRSHPTVLDEGTCTAAARYPVHDEATRRFSEPLRQAPASAVTVPFGAQDLTALRGLVRLLTAEAPLARGVMEDLVLAAHELSTNSVVHGGGRGVLRTWQEPDAFVVEVQDEGWIDDPLVGRDMLQGLAENGRGIWMANQLCDLVQVRSGASGTVVRLFVWL